MSKDRRLFVGVAVAVVVVVVLATRPRDHSEPAKDETAPAQDEDATRRAGFAVTANRSFAEHPATGFRLSANVRGDGNKVLVLDVTSEPCTAQVLRQIELVMGSKNVLDAGFESIECAGAGAAIVP